MPTGYTAAIEEDTTLAEWAMVCARAFGALVEMRDEPMDAKIPDEFKPSPHHAQALERSRRELAELEAMGDEAIMAKQRDEIARRLQSRDDSIARNEATRRKYLRMREMVIGWTPPTPDHKGLKDFMLQQIDESIKFDCSSKKNIEGYYPVPQIVPPDQWREKEIAEAKRNVEYHDKKLREDEERARSRTQWVRDLRASLKGTP